MGLEKYRAGFDPAVHEQELPKPYTWKKSKLVFVNSMSDLFHEAVPLAFIQMVFRVMNDTPQHTYQVLTKRADRLQQLNSRLTWTDNIWMGVSVENQKVTDRIDFLRLTGAKVKFLSLEPLIGPLPALNLMGLDWVIAGGESGFKPRPIKEQWVIDIKDQCQTAGIPFFFKQWGGRSKKATGRLLEGRTWDEMPSALTYSSN